VAAHLPGVPRDATELLGDYPPYLPEAGELPPAFAPAVQAFLAQFPNPEQGPPLARRAIEQFTNPDGDELLITYSQIVAWFVRDALGAPNWRWLGLNAINAALTIIKYAPGRPPELVAFDQVS
jgi:hypothetical protein